MMEDAELTLEKRLPSRDLSSCLLMGLLAGPYTVGAGL